MNPWKVLSGYELVAKGTTKLDASLPEVGVKDVTPNGSWLEQKHIQSSLEARKHLIEVERIEKSGTLSHAEWCEELILAQVTKKAGSCWQYFGHNVGKQLYLYPEEALFLMETNSLLLKYNSVPVSLQQAYSLLLRDKVSIVHYKVYASLGRVGFKVYRHKDIQYKNEPQEDIDSIKTNDDDKETANESEINSQIHEDEHEKHKSECAMDVCHENLEQSTELSTTSTTETSMEINIKPVNELTSENLNIDTTPKNKQNPISKIAEQPDIFPIEHTNENDASSQEFLNHSKLWQLRNRLKDTKNSHKYLKNIPDLYQKQIATLKVPDDSLLPNHIFLNKTTYLLNIENIRTKSERPATSNSRSNTTSDEANGVHVRRISNLAIIDNSRQILPNPRYLGHNPHFRPRTQFWRPQPNVNYFQFHLLFQRPFLAPFANYPRFNFTQRTPPPLIRHLSNIVNNRNMANNAQKRKRNIAKIFYLNEIKNLASRLQGLASTGHAKPENIRSLHDLVNSFNERFQTRYSVTDSYDIVASENIIEIIDLVDDEQFQCKKPRMDNRYNENLDKLKEISIRLKGLETKKKATSRHRRSVSNVIKTFNKSYNADIYMNSNYEIIDKRHITLESSSDSDCVVEETTASSKKLKNPFNILKRLSEKCRKDDNGQTNDSSYKENETVKNNKYSESLLKTFKRGWLPQEDNFGRIEVPPRKLMYKRLMDTYKEEVIYDFLRSQPTNFESWLEIKICFWKNFEDMSGMSEHEPVLDENPSTESIIKPEDCTDITSVLQKLRIISNCKDVDQDTTLNVDFDVYNRDIQNFRKSSPPKPHFRIICISESNKLPQGSDIATLHSKYQDDVPIVFACVGVGAVSYLQMNPTDLPVYIPSSEVP